MCVCVPADVCVCVFRLTDVCVCVCVFMLMDVYVCVHADGCVCVCSG